MNSDLADKPMVLMALAPIRAETEAFVPMSEGRSKYTRRPDVSRSTSATTAGFSAIRGRLTERLLRPGFVRLTGRFKVRALQRLIGMSNQLLLQPELANAREIAAKLLAAFLKDKERTIRQARLVQDYRTTRKLVKGGSHDRFADAYTCGDALIIGIS